MHPVSELLNRLYLKGLSIISRKKNGYNNYLMYISEYNTEPTIETSEILRDMFKTTSCINDVIQSTNELFDEEYYKYLYPDVRDSKIDPRYHYLLWGWRENRTPSRFFDPNYYRDNSQDITETEFPLAHFYKQGKREGRPSHPVSNELWFKPAVPKEADWETVAPAKRNTSTRAVVVIPVYKGFEETVCSIWHALASRCGSNYSLLVINDNSPDEKLVLILDKLAKMGLFDYHVNSENLGFVRTVNLSLAELSHNIDVVLLNSDAYVFPGWFERLVAHADKDPIIATITPLSNNATICSYPQYNADNFRALEVAPDAIDRLAAVVNRGISVETPTGVGFCFYMRRAAIDKIGPLDSDAFKFGYGEENDFCMRANLEGMKNVIAGDVFVYHTGSVSFSATKEINYNRGQLNLQKKHPHYESVVQNHITADPELKLRRPIDAERLLSHFQGSVLFITHKWSGGIETYVKHLRSKLEKQGKKCVILRVHDRSFASFEARLDRELFIPNLNNIDLRTSFDYVCRLISKLGPSVIHINSFAGLEWAFQKKVIEFLGSLPSERVLVGHDYSPITHHYQLLRPDNVFIDRPSIETLAEWDLMRVGDDCVDACSPVERQRTFAELFDQGVRIEVPSESTRVIYGAYFPRHKMNVVPHDDHLPATNQAIQPPVGATLRVAVVGAIGRHKGSDLLAALAADARNRALPLEYHLIGYSNDDERLASIGVKIWGRYRHDTEALEKLDLVAPTFCFVPSLWPETFCYTLSLSLKKGIPTVVFDIGAQSERVKAEKKGKILPIHLSTQPVQLSNALLAIDANKLWSGE